MTDLGADVLSVEVGPDFKGFAPQAYGRRLGDIVDDRTSLFDGPFSPPLMAVRRSALDGNISAMAGWVASHPGVQLAPHGKTTLAPDIWRRQLAAGAWGTTVATPAQIVLARLAGIPRVFVANEIIDPSVVAWMLRDLEQHPDHDALSYVDSSRGVELVGEGIAAARSSRPFDVLVEMGPRGGRTGCRSVDEAHEVARAASREPGLRVVGVAGYEGGIGHDLSESTLREVRDFLSLMRDTAQALVSAGLVVDRGGGVILSAGGSVYFDEVVTVLNGPLADGTPTTCIIRPGAYATHDSGFYDRLSPLSRPGLGQPPALRPALEVWGEVLSTPEPGFAVASIGRRDASFDQQLPIPNRVVRDRVSIDASALSVTALNDQHAYVAVPEGFAIRPGDWIGMGIVHPCTALDKWRLLVEVDDDDYVVAFIRLYF